MKESIGQFLEHLKNSGAMEIEDYIRGEKLYFIGGCQVLTHSKNRWEVLAEVPYEEPVELRLEMDGGQKWTYSQKNSMREWDSLSVAALLQIKEEITHTEPRVHPEGKTYTREGMIKRVMQERRDKARRADYRIEFADNIYGEHILTNEKGVRYKITLRDFENETGYIDNPDLRTNKLGTTKHI